MASSERFQGANTIHAGTLSPYWGEHAARYVFALPFVEGKTVLDIACGTGYGLGLLKRKARQVIGVDVDMEAARAARSECGKNAAVILGNGLGLPFSDDSFDIVTSFETLEHLHDRAGLLSEFKRVLRPEGILLLSTPNAHYTLPLDGKPSNPYHIFEYTPEELRSELEAFFQIDEFWGQTLNPEFRIPPFQDAQPRLSNDLKTQVMLFGWKIMNKVPFTLREKLSDMIWKKPFYPAETDYRFTAESVETAPVLFAVCRKGS